MLCLVGKLVNFCLRQCPRLLLQYTKEMQPGCTLHLLKPFDRHHRRKWLPLALNDELIVTEGNAVEDVAELLADF
jgi:hypothetical protein